MVLWPNISPEDEKKHVGEMVVSLDGKVLAFGKDTMEAINNAKKVVPDLDQKDVLISRIHPEYIAA